MAETVKEIEGIPAAWPTTPSGLSTGAAALAAGPIWARIEGFTAVRYSARTIQWIAEGPGEWVPPLDPATITTVEAWTGTAWEAATLNPSPLGGYDLPDDGQYRFTGTLGAGPVPETVQEAFRRLAEYLGNATTGNAPSGAVHVSLNLGGDYSRTFDRGADWLARALINSGAADLLRPYRRA